MLVSSATSRILISAVFRTQRSQVRTFAGVHLGTLPTILAVLRPESVRGTRVGQHSLRRSKLVSAIHPVEPIADCLLCLLIFRQWLQLRQRDSHMLAGPPNPDEHFALALLFRRHAENFHYFLNLEDGDWPRESTPRRERNLHLAIKVIIPAHRTFAGIESIDDGLHGNSFLTYFISRACHCFTG